VDNIINLETRLEQTHVEHVAADTPEPAAIREQTRLLEKKIEELPAAFRTVFVLRAIEELSV
jgi:RNA polymerase sigma-70 factor (ECF subfamily)